MKRKKHIPILFVLIPIVWLLMYCSQNERILILSEKEIPVIDFSLDKLTEVLNSSEIDYRYASIDRPGRIHGKTILVTARQTNESLRKLLEKEGGNISADLSEEGYQIITTNKNGRQIYWAVGADMNGTMYAGLDMAETISLKGIAGIREGMHKPYILNRGLKLNLPLDARIPGYSDSGDAFQKNIIEMWGMDFWHAYLDMMAENRYNVLSLWAPHPFPSMVHVPDYPDVALDDVMKSNFDFKKFGDNNFGGVAMGRKEIVDDLTTIKKMTIDEKIAHWQEVMQYAADRGIKIYLITWNIFVWGTDGKYGITDKIDNPVTIDYMRKSVGELFRTYPLLAGIGVTAGENMKGSTPDEKESWLWKTYGQGIMDVKKEFPDRPIRFIHRYWMSKIPDITKHFEGFPEDIAFDLSFKYVRARLYSHTDPNWANDVLAEAPEGQKFWWNLRNDDIFNFRWGDPEYVREFLMNMPGPEQTQGFYMGSDGYLWAREHTSTNPQTPRQWEFDKHWYRFLLWGRLAYDPNLTDSYFKSLLAKKFPAVHSGMLYDVWSRASKIIPAVNREHWEDWDFQWAVEYCDSRNRGFHSILYEGWKPGGTQVAAELHGHASYVLGKLDALRNTDDPELMETLGDMEAMAHLGNYYAEKILAADFRDTDPIQAIQHLKLAAGHWSNYAATAGRQYNPQVLSKIHYVDWNQLYKEVLNDISLMEEKYGISGTDTVPDR